MKTEETLLNILSDILIWWSCLGMGGFGIWIEDRLQILRDPNHIKDYIIIFVCGPVIWILLLLVTLLRLFKK